MLFRYAVMCEFYIHAYLHAHIRVHTGGARAALQGHKISETRTHTDTYIPTCMHAYIQEEQEQLCKAIRSLSNYSIVEDPQTCTHVITDRLKLSFKMLSVSLYTYLHVCKCVAYTYTLCVHIYVYT